MRLNSREIIATLIFLPCVAMFMFYISLRELQTWHWKPPLYVVLIVVVGLILQISWFRKHWSQWDFENMEWKPDTVSAGAKNALSSFWFKVLATVPLMGIASIPLFKATPHEFQRTFSLAGSLWLGVFSLYMTMSCVHHLLVRSRK